MWARFVYHKAFDFSRELFTQVDSLECDDIGISYITKHPQSWECSCGCYNTYTWFCEKCGKCDPIPRDRASDPHKYSYPKKRRNKS